MEKPKKLLDAQQWAKATFEPCEFNDLRRTNRAVQVAQRMAECPSGSLPRQMQTWKEVIALYRLLDTPEVTFEALLQPHWQHTCQEIAAHPLVLLVQDTTELDLTPHPKTTGLGQVGQWARAQGCTCKRCWRCCRSREPCWAVPSKSRRLCRVSAPPGERRSQRRFRSEHETLDVWMRLVQRLGGLAQETTLVHVGDRTADMFDFFQACRSCRPIFWCGPCRTAGPRRPMGRSSLCSSVSVPGRPRDSAAFAVPARHGHQARSTQLQIAWDCLQVLPHRNRAPPTEPQQVWAIRVWEDQPPWRRKPLEWILLT